MKKMNSFLKVSVLVLFAVVIVSSCKKTEDPYATYTPEREAGLIQEWLATMATNKMNIDTTSTGLYYIVAETGLGEKVKSGDSVTVKYTGMFLDGSIFDSSDYHAADSTYTYLHQDPNSSSRTMIKGWEEGIEAMNKGEKAVFLIPSAKAYGTTGYGPIPPNTPLLFVIEVINIKP